MIATAKPHISEGENVSQELAVTDEPRELQAADELNPLMLLQQAVQNGMDPAQLKALVDLQEQWRAARAKDAFSKAMNAVQIEMPCVVRDATNSQTSSRYVRMETVTHQAKAVYTSHGFSLSFSEDESGIEKFKRIVCLVRHIEGHSERHWIDLPLDGFGAKGNPIGQMNPVQAAISTGSYGQRVLTCRVFNITIADTDLDGNGPPPLRDNPNHNQDAPTAKPRGQRQKPQTEVSEEQRAHVWAEWWARNQDNGGDMGRAHAAFATWVMARSNRGEWNTRRLADWKHTDYLACCSSLSVPTLEELTNG